MSPIKNTLMSLWSRKAIESKMIVTIASVALVLSACGESGTTENVTQVTQQNMEVVTDVSLLPPCSATNEGELVWVRNEATPRMCSGGLWYAVAEGSVAATCSTQPLLDGSGLKILCGGDSIGVVLNGKDGAQGIQGKPGVQGKQGVAGKDGTPGADGAPGADGKDGIDGKDGEDGTNGTDGKDGADGKDGKDGNDGAPGAGCSMEAIDELSVRVICGVDSAILYVGELPDTTGQGEVVLDSEKIAISLDEVSGVTQKGPFLMGSKVLVREMEDGRTLTQTGNSFNGKILNDNGEFKINARMLVSQYVMLEASGYYRNEVTGESSNSELTLFAITDVNDRNIVNVNLLTHLEYERVVYLVTQEKMKVRKAKKQAQKEVFGLLGIDATDFSNSEDLNIAGASDEDGALLAFSLMFQGDRSVADLTALLQTVANDMEKDGIWNDATTRMNIAEWSADADSAGRLAVIRNNVSGWNLSNTVPNFEQYVRAFWYKEYGLDSCTADSVGRVKAATAGKQQYTSTRYICRANLWQIANDYEKDTYGWKDTTDGALKNGDVTGKVYVFDLTGSNGDQGWRLADDIEKVNGGCRTAVYGEIRRDTKNGGFYQCQEVSHRWELVNNNLLIDTQQWTEGDDGFSKWGDSIGVVTGGSKICYVYDTSAAYNGWRKGNDNDCTLGLLGCTAGRAGRMQLAEDGSFYNCASNMWKKVEGTVPYNTEGWACLDSNAGEMKLGLYNTDVYFVCDGNAWREARTDEELSCRDHGLCKACTENGQGIFWKHDGNQLVCDNKTWRTPNCAEIATESLCTANDSAVVWECEDLGNFKIDYICSQDPEANNKLVWHPVRHPFEYTLADWNKKKAEYYTAAKHPNANYGEDLVDHRDGNVYKTVYIEGLRWMAENLRYADSSATVNLKGQTTCGNGRIIDSFKPPIGNPKDCEIGGALYSWTAAMNLNEKWLAADARSLLNIQQQGICPDGWHVPSSGEWMIFEKNKLTSYQAQGFTSWANAVDDMGISILPIGYFAQGWTEHGFKGVGNITYFWTATDYGEYSAGDAVFGTVQYYVNYLSSTRKEYRVPIRCIENYAGPQIVELLTLTDGQLEQWKGMYYTNANLPGAVYGADLEDARDGNVYKTVIIDGKRWMAENLRYVDSLTNVNLKGNMKCFQNKIENCQVHGTLYKWLGALNLDAFDRNTSKSQGICPTGWHVPDTTDWRSLEQAAGGASALQMKRMYWTYWKNATDEIGFSAIPDLIEGEGGFGTEATFWLSTAHENERDAYLFVIRPDDLLLTDAAAADSYFSPTRYVRCVEDDPVDP
jgi:uncharacterized protein (TIGR02145 family)